MSHRRQLLDAARSGNREAQFSLACDYDFNLPKKKQLAIRWYHAAAEQGHAEAQNFLGESYRDGWTVKRDLQKAIYWLRLAAQQGNADAQGSLGVMLFYGKGIRRDRAAALKWYRRAARQGQNSAC